jgi:hexosaminidase
VVPEFDSLAHASSWNVGYPGTTIFCGCDDDSCPPSSTDPATGLPNHYANVINPVSNKSFAVLTGFFAEMSEIFPDEQMHLGIDEVLWTSLNRSSEVTDFIKANGKKLDDDGFKFAIRYYIKRLQLLIESLGKKSSV